MKDVANTTTRNAKRPGSNGGIAEGATTIPFRSQSPRRTYDIALIGLSISSSWGNGHATTYRSLLRELSRRGHRVTFYERDVPWYADNRDMPVPPFCRLVIYDSLDELRRGHGKAIRSADVVVVGSFVPDGVGVCRWVFDTSSAPTAFYDIDTPVTLAKMDREDYEYIHPDCFPEFAMYLSFTGGGTLRRLEDEFGVRAARPLYCSVDPEDYYPEETGIEYDLGYMGTYSDDRQPGLESRMVDAARDWPDGRFVVAGPGYPDGIHWPHNVSRIDHLPPADHRRFYNSQRYTLNLTRADMIRVGYAPSVRLFEAAACGTPIISDYWEGIETILVPEREILISRGAEETLTYLREISEEERRAIGRGARQKILSTHTAAHRAVELECYLDEIVQSERESVTD